METCKNVYFDLRVTGWCNELGGLEYLVVVTCNAMPTDGETCMDGGTVPVYILSTVCLCTYSPPRGGGLLGPLAQLSATKKTNLDAADGALPTPPSRTSWQHFLPPEASNAHEDLKQSQRVVSSVGVCPRNMPSAAVTRVLGRQKVGERSFVRISPSAVKFSSLTSSRRKRLLPPITPSGPSPPPENLMRPPRCDEPVGLPACCVSCCIDTESLNWCNTKIRCQTAPSTTAL